MHTIRKAFKFEMAHQLADAVTAACYETIHGHSYTVELFLEATKLDDAGMVLDFGALGEFKAQLMERFDHALLIPDAFNAAYKKVLARNNKKVWFTPANPTAEWMASVIYTQAVNLFTGHASHVTVAAVRVHETDTGYAEYRP